MNLGVLAKKFTSRMIDTKQYIKLQVFRYVMLWPLGPNLTGQRPSDVLKMRENDIIDGTLQIRQEKTGKKLRISIEGELLTLIESIKQRKAQYTIKSLHLIIDETGQRFTSFMLRSHFDKAREKAGHQ